MRAGNTSAFAGYLLPIALLFFVIGTLIYSVYSPVQGLFLLKFFISVSYLKDFMPVFSKAAF